MSKIQIKNRWSGSIIFECELSAEKMESTSLGAKLGFAILSGADLREADLREADLREADLSGADLSGADLREADLSAADLSAADLRDTDLRDADLRWAYLSDADLRGADLHGAYLHGADLLGADLRGVDLRGAYLRGAYLHGTYLHGAYLTGAVLSGVPVIQDIHQVVYAAASAEGALDMSTWHSGCGTAHCRAGWVTHLAGEPGAKLERDIGAAAAAALIYLASDPALERVPNWCASNEEALADMKRLAEKEASRPSPPVIDEDDEPAF